ncbi:transglutaminase-like domain-containing protein [Azonexus sp.]|uniref:transglutaminase-like domain-containing protein n=1 Tax=Azonexus sp. TaxID=1872668 RepID=UPI0027BAFDE5|nr:transglutaminase-like domain-containing protein [Azonexus sp.]
MKRRDFLASTALFSLFAGEALAAPRTPAKKKPVAVRKKPAGKPAKKPATSARNATAAGHRPQVHSAATPLIDNPPEGTSASRLPPVRAQELPTDWRTYEIITTITLDSPGQSARIWLPIPSSQDNLYQRLLGHSWQGNTSAAGILRQPDGLLEAFHAEWRNAEKASLRLVTHVSTADRHFDVSRRSVAPERDDILRRNLQTTSQIPNDGLAKQLGERIVGRIRDPVAQVKAIYDWLCDNAIYDPSLPGCGTGNVNQQLISAQYGGRSADINGLFVAVCRSIGIPARCVFGLRTGPSRLFRSLGLRSDDATRSQHVRAEFYLPGFGWIPVDPSDVRRAVAIEALPEQDGRLASLRRVLFGVWEMNWVAFNVGTDIQLPEQDMRLPFFALPEIHIGGARIDPLNTATPLYSISARKVEL